MKKVNPKSAHPPRYIIIDAIRGLAVLLMIIFHVAYDLNVFRFVRIDFLKNPFWYGLSRFIVFLFLICVGMGLALVHKSGIKWNRLIRRFIKIGGWAAVITVITFVMFPKNLVYFGVLHCIAVTSVTGVFFVDRPMLSLLLGVILIVSNLVFQPTLLHISEWLGVNPMDYVPFYPWFGVVLAGIYLKSINFHKIPIKKTFPIRLLEVMGRHSLKIYLLHRPIIFGFFLFLYKLTASA